MQPLPTIYLWSEVLQVGIIDSQTELIVKLQKGLLTHPLFLSSKSGCNREVNRRIEWLSSNNTPKYFTQRRYIHSTVEAVLFIHPSNNGSGSERRCLHSVLRGTFLSLRITSPETRASINVLFKYVVPCCIRLPQWRQPRPPVCHAGGRSRHGRLPFHRPPCWSSDWTECPPHGFCILSVVCLPSKMSQKIRAIWLLCVSTTQAFTK